MLYVPDDVLDWPIRRRVLKQDHSQERGGESRKKEWRGGDYACNALTQHGRYQNIDHAHHNQSHYCYIVYPLLLFHLYTFIMHPCLVYFVASLIVVS